MKFEKWLKINMNKNSMNKREKEEKQVYLTELEMFNLCVVSLKNMI